MGETIRFSALAIGSDGLSKGRKFLPWSEIRDVRLENRLVAIWKQDCRPARGDVDTGCVPNLYVFLAVVWFSFHAGTVDHLPHD